MNYTDFQPGLKARAATAALALAGTLTVLGLGLATLTSEPALASEMTADVRAALAARLPKTPIDALNCEGFGGLCEVVSGKTLFYVDQAARYLVVGRLYDMETRRDVTAARLLELNPDLIAAGAARAGKDAAEKGDEPGRAVPAHVDLNMLPTDGAIHWGNPAAPKVVVFSDFQCGYCQRLTGELAKAGLHVEERPISIFGAKSRALSEAVLCVAIWPRRCTGLTRVRPRLRARAARPRGSRPTKPSPRRMASTAPRSWSARAMARCSRATAPLRKSAASSASTRAREAADGQDRHPSSAGARRARTCQFRLRHARRQRQGQLHLQGTRGRLRTDLGDRRARDPQRG